MDDKQESVRLIEEIGYGSREAFDRFYEMFIPFVFQIAYQITGDRLEAEDVCHDVFLEVYQKSEQYNASKGSVKAWLAVKTRSRSLDRLRKKKGLLVDRLELFLTREASDAELHVLSHIEKEIVSEALKHLPQDQQKVIYGCYFEGMTQREMASEMNRPLGSIKSMIRYGLNNLRKQKGLLHWTGSSGGEK
ncbi:RNA polymerase sigma factor [Aquibacillus albus]|uniref:RNA polymerase sigma-70 factor (ECF subfamily) n=1 Tax=Aquibacillus albus TaxID=1168171 RepID=A0ABS2N2Q2_9BACI|nr:sigma-70 family RNA polymerase sigma factor [Aquibacillus albus]MBM7572404.1 RNA polymerase sigma-70 factor (ECF subfamily) [Aquibacillus albus]